ncbi:unnamed protein product [Prorocentrum cordatum]|uniref:Nucleotide-diphospho-sugar transferase domain-containing protein n=1 Tax=Prorocentrum cordatum TaxID=2364126 RepID=A0ABN9W649_9DINO|nr:unnamed protein product [Polarella glacialis]
MACSQLLAFTLVCFVSVCQGVTIRQVDRDAKKPELSPEWVQNVSFLLPANGIPNHKKATAVVTFAGKKNPEYIDGAVMLGMSVQKYLPEYPMVALIIAGMKSKYRSLLKSAGWSTVMVPNWDKEYCGKECDLEFLGRWHDSFEKINAFRLPFARVLFMDSDTYIFGSHVQSLVTMPLADGHIAMAKDGCKEEYNSGVMLFSPGLAVFKQMLKMVTERKREQVLDQNLVNAAYRGKIVEVAREFNCVDTVGIQPGTTGKPCEHHCSKNAVIAHFTGHPKPTSPKRRLLELVRRPGAPALACMNTNFGSCGKWSEFYCDIRRYARNLSDELQQELKSTGLCCHPDRFSEKKGKKYDERNGETCLECPATLKLWSQHSPGEEKHWSANMRGNMQHIEGSYVKTNIPSLKFNGGRPIYVNQNVNPKDNITIYMYFIQANLVWVVGPDYTAKNGMGFAGMDAQCPRDAKYWSFHNGTGFERRHVDIRAGTNLNNPPKGTDHIVWNVTSHSWERERIVWEHENTTEDEKDD